MKFVTTPVSTGSTKTHTYRVTFKDDKVTFDVTLNIVLSIDHLGDQGYMRFESTPVMLIDHYRLAERFARLADVSLSSTELEELRNSLEEIVPHRISY